MMRRLRRQHCDDEAISLARSVAERGHMASAQATNGIRQLASAFNWANQTQQAERTLRPAARRGDLAAMCELARLLYGEGRADEAGKWRHRAASRGFRRPSTTWLPRA